MKKSSKLAIIICFSIVGVLTAILGGTLFAVNYNLETAPTVEIVDDGHSLIFTTMASENCKVYRFRFSSREGVVSFDSQSNSLFLSASQLVPGQTYNVSVCYLREIGGNNSKYGKEKTFSFYSYLETPKLKLEASKLSWASVKGADYYLLYCNNAALTMPKAVTEIDISSLPGGKADLFVVACSYQNFYKQSNPSNIINKDCQHSLSAFSNITLNTDTMILTADNVEKLDKINIHIGSKVYQTSNFSVLTLVNGSFRYTINIKAIYMQSVQIGVSPVEDENNIYSGEILWA